MPNKLLALLSVFLLCSRSGMSQQLKPQAGDTVFIYQTVTVYDTIFIHDTIRVNNIMKLSPRIPVNTGISNLQNDKADVPVFLVISGNRAATIDPGSIIPVNPKNLTSMKTYSFIGLLFFAFQHMVVAQSDFGITMGMGSWWATCNQPGIKSEYSSSGTAGIYLDMPAGNHLLIHSAFNYTFLRSNYSYKTTVDIPSSAYFGDGESASNYHQFSLPLEAGYDFGRLKLLAGLEYAYRLSDSWLNQKMNLLNVVGSAKYPVTEKLSLELGYYHGLLNDYRYSWSLMDPATGSVIRNYDYSWKSSRLMLTLAFNLHPGSISAKSKPEEGSSTPTSPL